MRASATPVLAALALICSTGVESPRAARGNGPTRVLKGSREYFDLTIRQTLVSRLTLTGERRGPDLECQEFGEGGCHGPQDGEAGGHRGKPGAHAPHGIVCRSRDEGTGAHPTRPGLNPDLLPPT